MQSSHMTAHCFETVIMSVPLSMYEAYSYHVALSSTFVLSIPGNPYVSIKLFWNATGHAGDANVPLAVCIRRQFRPIGLFSSFASQRSPWATHSMVK